MLTKVVTTNVEVEMPDQVWVVAMIDCDGGLRGKTWLQHIFYDPVVARNKADELMARKGWVDQVWKASTLDWMKENEIPKEWYCWSNNKSSMVTVLYRTTIS